MRLLVGVPDSRTGLAEALGEESRNWRVETVTDLTTLQERVSEDSIDCVVCCDEMLAADVAVVVEQLTAVASCPVVAVTPDPDSAEAALDAGGADFVLGSSAGIRSRLLAYRIANVLDGTTEINPDGASSGIGRDGSQRVDYHREIVDAMGDVAYVTDSDGRYICVNQRLTEVTGWSRTDALGRESVVTTSMAADDLEQYRAAVDDILAGERDDVRLEMPLDLEPMGRRTAEFRLTQLVIDGDIEGVISIVRDVTERSERRRELERKNERLDEFTSVVSHDLRNPLQIAQSNLEYTERTGSLDRIDKIETALGRMTTLIDRLLTLARGGQDIESPEQVRLGPIIRRAWDTVETGGAILEYDGNTGIHCDPARLGELFENLFRNAIEHGAPNRDTQARQDAVEPETDIAVTVGYDDEQFWVADDGRGIPADSVDRVFETGYTTAENGTGFGLSIVKRIADAHGWVVRIGESDTGGTRFEFDNVELVSGSTL